MESWFVTYAPCVTNGPKTDQNTAKGLSGLRVKAIVEPITIWNTYTDCFYWPVRFSDFLWIHFKLSVWLGEDNLWFDVTNGNLCTVGLGRGRRVVNVPLRSCTSSVILSFFITKMTIKNCIYALQAGVIQGRGQGFSRGRVGQGFSWHPYLLAIYKKTLYLIHFVNVQYLWLPILAVIAQIFQYRKYLKYLFLAVANWKSKISIHFK